MNHKQGSCARSETDLQEDAHHCQAVRLSSSLCEAGVLSVPVHQVELGLRRPVKLTVANDEQNSGLLAGCTDPDFVAIISLSVYV